MGSMSVNHSKHLILAPATAGRAGQILPSLPPPTVAKLSDDTSSLPTQQASHPFWESYVLRIVILSTQLSALPLPVLQFVAMNSAVLHLHIRTQFSSAGHGTVDDTVLTQHNDGSHYLQKESFLVGEQLLAVSHISSECTKTMLSRALHQKHQCHRSCSVWSKPGLIARKSRSWICVRCEQAADTQHTCSMHDYP